MKTFDEKMKDLPEMIYCSECIKECERRKYSMCCDSGLKKEVK